MKGRHHIIVESPRLKYEFEIKRNLTIVQGDSATGKTTLIELLSDARENGEDSAVRITSDVQCRVFSDSTSTWRQALEIIKDSIVFIDEDNHFICTKEFAEVVRGSSNYYVLITRETLSELPYSIEEIYGIRTSGKYHFPQQIYHEFYPIYDKCTVNTEIFGKQKRQIVTEDAKSGYDFYESFCDDSNMCISAEGNAKVYDTLRKMDRETFVAVIADGAAFGPFIKKILEFAEVRKRIMLYCPESFEWLILKSGVITKGKSVSEIRNPENYVDSGQYMSWEQFFTNLLIQMTKDDDIRRYQKSRLMPYYYQDSVKCKILEIFPPELRIFITGMKEKSENMKSIHQEDVPNTSD